VLRCPQRAPGSSGMHCSGRPRQAKADARSWDETPERAQGALTVAKHSRNPGLLQRLGTVSLPGPSAAMAQIVTRCVATATPDPSAKITSKSRAALSATLPEARHEQHAQRPCSHVAAAGGPQAESALRDRWGPARRSKSDGQEIRPTPVQPGANRTATAASVCARASYPPTSL